MASASVEHKNAPQEKIAAGSNAEEKRFLLNFITENFLGPDVLAETPRRSILGRRVHGSTPYTKADLGSSVLTLNQLEALYLYFTEKAKESAHSSLHGIHMYLNGTLCNWNGDKRQFQEFFPRDLHPMTPAHYGVPKLFHGLVIIDEANVADIDPNYLSAFKKLTGFKDLKLDKKQFRLFCTGMQRKKLASHEKNKRKRATEGPLEPVLPPAIHVEPSPPVLSLTTYVAPLQSVPPHELPLPSDTLSGRVTAVSEQMECPGDMKIYFALPDDSPVRGKWVSDTGAGSTFGHVKIGICCTAYHFEANLFGISRDPSAFSFQITGDGIVKILGEMKTGNKFRVTFRLPGYIVEGTQIANLTDHDILACIVMRLMPGLADEGSAETI